MQVEKIATRTDGDKNYNNIDVVNGVRFPEGKTLRFCEGRKELDTPDKGSYTYNSYNGSSEKIDLFTTLGTLSLSTLRSEKTDYKYPQYQVQAPVGTLNRRVIDYIEQEKEKAYGKGEDVNDGFIAACACQAILNVLQEYQSGATFANNNVAFTIHRVPYYANTYDSKNGCWLDEPKAREQVHLYLPNAQIPAQLTHAAIDAMYGTAQTAQTAQTEQTPPPF